MIDKVGAWIWSASSLVTKHEQSRGCQQQEGAGDHDGEEGLCPFAPMRAARWRSFTPAGAAPTVTCWGGGPEPLVAGLGARAAGMTKTSKSATSASGTNRKTPESEMVLDALERRVPAVLHLDPITAPAATVAALTDASRPSPRVPWQAASNRSGHLLSTPRPPARSCASCLAQVRGSRQIVAAIRQAVEGTWGGRPQ